jgi:nicotinamide mononucleotide transporter
MCYVVAGFFGWYMWNRKGKSEAKITVMHPKNHIVFNLVAIAFAACIYLFLSLVAGGNDPLLDSATTAYAILTTWLVARRVLSNWIYWFIINSATAVLYHINDLHVLRSQMIVFAGLSIVGWLSWKRKMTQH